MIEDEMVGQCHGSYQHDFDPTPGGSGIQEGLACSGPWGHKESDMTSRLNNSNNMHHISISILVHCFRLTEAVSAAPGSCFQHPNFQAINVSCPIWEPGLYLSHILAPSSSLFPS